MLEFLKINDKHYVVEVRKVAGEQTTVEEHESKLVLQCNLFDLSQLWCETITVEDLIEREKVGAVKGQQKGRHSNLKGSARALNCFGAAVAPKWWFADQWRFKAQPFQFCSRPMIASYSTLRRLSPKPCSPAKRTILALVKDAQTPSAGTYRSGWSTMCKAFRWRLHCGWKWPPAMRFVLKIDVVQDRF